jgi:hypothetical protein
MVARMARDYFAKGKKTESHQATMLYHQNTSTEKTNAETNVTATHRMWVVQTATAGVDSVKERPSEETYYKNATMSCK